jgi:REP element-mobilizing transposase RayT
MARRLRIEYAGAYYHVINRGNYRSWIFETAGARASFLDCLEQVCESQGWRLHAWCLMGNHYHLLVETPEPNLVWGMKWLQSTFANRFNRFRKANGHVFQGRYKALLLDGDAVGPVCHYIHLKKAVLADQKDTALRKAVEAEASEIREPRWEAGFSRALELLDRSESNLSDSPKGAEWKVATARWLRERYLAPHRWIAARLNMGGVGSVQTLVSRHRRESENQSSSWEVLNSYEILD